MSGAGRSLSLAEKAALLLSVDPVGLGGIVLKGPAGPMRNYWMRWLTELFPAGTPVKRLPVNTSDERLLGGLDLAGTLQAGRPVFERGILAEADGGLVIAQMAERLPPVTASILAAAMDRGEVISPRNAAAEPLPARFALIAFDEGVEDEVISPALSERLAFTLALDAIEIGKADMQMREDVLMARARLSSIEMEDKAFQALSAAALSLGIASLRAPMFAIRAARAAAALDASGQVSEEHLSLAAQLVLAHRATMLPADEEQTEEAPPQEEQKNDSEGEAQPQDKPLEDMILDSARAAIPPDVLRDISAGMSKRRSRNSGGRAGALQKSLMRGRPVGVRQGDPRRARLSLLSTLNAAAPWQVLRRRENPQAKAKVLIRREDFRIRRFQERTSTTTIFVVDASGSSALHRLTEAKGAVELLLAECYVRRDQVALLSFRRSGAELLLPPTRSLARAKRSLAGMPGGGGTPLASAIAAASELADGLKRKNQTPVVIFLTDGQANIARDGSSGRERAHADAVEAARGFRAQGILSVVVDTSPKPAAQARTIAVELDAKYLALPHADAAALQRGVTAMTRLN